MSTLLVIINIIVFPGLALAAIGPEPSSGAPPDFSAPAAPSKVELKSDGQTITLAWTDPPEPDFHFLELLRNDGTGTEVTGHGRVRISKGVGLYNDTEVRAGQIYRYRFRVSDTALNTRLSEEYEIMVQAPTPVATPSPAAPATTPPPATPVVAEGARPATPTTGPLVVVTPQVSGVGETLQLGAFAYGAARVRALQTEQALAKALAQDLDKRLPGAFNRLFHQRTITSKQWWYTYVNAYIYGGYTLEEIKQSVRFGGKTVHPAIAAPVWRKSADYQAYISR